jgi:hypothetical protein
MARFIVVHQIVENTSVDDLRAVRKSLYAAAQGAPEWRNSWYVPATNQLICEWEAQTSDAIRDVLIASGAMAIVPIKTVDEVVPSGPADFPGEFAGERSETVS